ncbi:hypothetical protein C8Q80DRAFT_892347 [Daedaleopsis nitida]|nr:hypothetical protein C8Q80DRAFT_892347 [Daedaleopsis nitida]
MTHCSVSRVARTMSSTPLARQLQPNATYTLPEPVAIRLTDLTETIADLLYFETGQYLSRVLGQVKEAILSSVFFGLYSILALLATSILCRKGMKAAPKVVMLLVIITIYASTTIYWVTVICETFHELRLVMEDCRYGLVIVNFILDTLSQVFPDGDISFPPVNATAVDRNNWWQRPLQECTGTASLTINVTLGDAMVWWRAWILWQNSRAIRVLCILLVSATFVAGVVATAHGCNSSTASSIVELAGTSTLHDAMMLTSGSLYTGDKWGLAASEACVALTETSLQASQETCSAQSSCRLCENKGRENACSTCRVRYTVLSLMGLRCGISVRIEFYLARLRWSIRD